MSDPAPETASAPPAEQPTEAAPSASETVPTQNEAQPTTAEKESEPAAETPSTTESATPAQQSTPPEPKPPTTSQELGPPSAPAASTSSPTRTPQSPTRSTKPTITTSTNSKTSGASKSNHQFQGSTSMMSPVKSQGHYGTSDAIQKDKEKRRDAVRKFYERRQQEMEIQDAKVMYQNQLYVDKAKRRELERDPDPDHPQTIEEQKEISMQIVALVTEMEEREEAYNAHVGYLQANLVQLNAEEQLFVRGLTAQEKITEFKKGKKTLGELRRERKAETRNLMDEFNSFFAAHGGKEYAQLRTVELEELKALFNKVDFNETGYIEERDLDKLVRKLLSDVGLASLEAQRILLLLGVEPYDNTSVSKRDFLIFGTQIYKLLLSKREEFEAISAMKEEQLQTRAKQAKMDTNERDSMEASYLSKFEACELEMHRAKNTQSTAATATTTAPQGKSKPVAAETQQGGETKAENGATTAEGSMTTTTTSTKPEEATKKPAPPPAPAPVEQQPTNSGLQKLQDLHNERKMKRIAWAQKAVILTNHEMTRQRSISATRKQSQFAANSSQSPQSPKRRKEEPVQEKQEQAAPVVRPTPAPPRKTEADRRGSQNHPGTPSSPRRRQSNASGPSKPPAQEVYKTSLKSALDRAPLTGTTDGMKPEVIQQLRTFFDILTNNSPVMTGPHLSNLFALFTPCGCDADEGSTFLKEECRVDKEGLTFDEFIKFGTLIKHRAHRCEEFQKFSLSQKKSIIESRREHNY